MNIYFYRDQAHDRLVTVCIYIHASTVYIGIAIQNPIDDPDPEIGNKIAKGRAIKARKESGRRNELMIRCLTGLYNEVLKNDKFFFEQIGRSYFFDFVHNPNKYIKGFNNE